MFSGSFFCRPDPGEDDVNLRRRVRLLLKGITVVSPSNLTPVQHFLGSYDMLAYLHCVRLIQGVVALYLVPTPQRVV